MKKRLAMLLLLLLLLPACGQKRGGTEPAEAQAIEPPPAEAGDDRVQFAGRQLLEDEEKEPYLSLIQDMLEDYQTGTVEQNPLEPRFQAPPEGVALPAVRSADDFVVISRPGAEDDLLALCAYVGMEDGWTMRFSFFWFFVDQESEPVLMLGAVGFEQAEAEV